MKRGAVVGLALALTVAASTWASSDLLAAVRAVRGDSIPTNQTLMDIAARRAQEITGDFSHDGAGAPWPWGEILAVNNFDASISVDEAIEGWLNSPGHRDVLLGQWTHVGVGAVSTETSYYYVVVFANIPTSTPEPPTATPRPVPSLPRVTLPPTDTQ